MNNLLVFSFLLSLSLLGVYFATTSNLSNSHASELAALKQEIESLKALVKEATTSQLKEIRDLLKEKAQESRAPIQECAERPKPGRATCSAVDRTGGWCLSGDQQRYQNHPIPQHHVPPDAVLARKLCQLFQNDEVYDFGAGVGQYGVYFLHHCQGVKWRGFDGASNVETFTNNFVSYTNLTVHNWLGKRRKWVMSLEVGEHIPKEFEHIFVENLVVHASQFIILSWAIPGQGGFFHVNERSPDYVIKMLDGYGFAHLSQLSEKLREGNEYAWFRNTVMIFAKDKSSESDLLARVESKEDGGK